jgi:hypothetical protein
LVSASGQLRLLTLSKRQYRPSVIAFFRPDGGQILDMTCAKIDAINTRDAILDRWVLSRLGRSGLSLEFNRCN